MIIETKINRFDGGMVNDPRDPKENTCRVVTNFDILTNPRKITPYYDSESGDSGATTSQKQNFCIALRTGTTYRLYALGVVSGTGRGEVLMKDLTTSSNDLIDGGWLTPNNNQSSAGAVSFNLFVYYAKTGLIYGVRASQYIWAFDPSSVASWSDSARDLTSFTNIAQGLVHSKDDILYIPYDNKILKNNNGSWTDAALTLPSHLYITSICEYGNYLAIAASPLSSVGDSYVYLWDRDATLATLSESINWGQGKLNILEEIDGYLIGISSIDGLSSVLTDRVVFKYYFGNTVRKFKEIRGMSVSGKGIDKQKTNNRLYFLLTGTIGGATKEGLFSVGLSEENFVLIHERTPNNNTASGGLKGFFIVNDFTFISYLSGSDFALSKTNDQASYTATAIYESKIFSAVNGSVKKKLLGVTVMTEYLPASGQIVLKYKIDSETSFTTIFTEATDNSISHSAINIESSGANLPEYKEIQFRIESTGGAEITGLKFKEEVLDKDLYQ